MVRTDDVAVLVVNYRSSTEIARTLPALAEGLAGCRVVVVDSRSDDAERTALVELARRHDWSAVLPGDNPGFGIGMNLAAERARELGARVLLLVNPDAELPPNAAALLIERVRRSPRALVAPVIRRPDGSVWSAGTDLYLDDGRMRSRRRRIPGAAVQPWLSGAVLALSLDLWDEVGGFADDYFLYWEDVDLSFRVERSGGRLVLVEEAEAVHAEGGSQSISATHSGQAKSLLYYRYNVRNRMLFAVRNLDASTIRRWRRTIRPVAWEILLQGGRRQLLRSPRPLWAIVTGMREARAIARSSSGGSAPYTAVPSSARRPGQESE